MKGVIKLAVLAASFTLSQAAFRDGCADAPWDSSTDYFLHKFGDGDNIPFSPEYNNTYVKIKNRQRRYVVLHCSNEPPPTSVIGDSALVIKAPVKNVAALDGFSQNLIEVCHTNVIVSQTLISF